MRHIREKEGKNHLAKLIHDYEGSSSMEYGILVGLIAAVIVASVTLFGASTGDLFGKAGTSIGGTRN